METIAQYFGDFKGITKQNIFKEKILANNLYDALWENMWRESTVTNVNIAGIAEEKKESKKSTLKNLTIPGLRDMAVKFSPETAKKRIERLL